MGVFGGAQPGAGRKRNSRTLRSGKHSERAKEILTDGGSTPLDVILRAMRWFEEQTELASERYEALLEKDPNCENEKTIEAFGNLKSFVRETKEAAKDAAPFCHPKLATTEFKGSSKPIGKIVVELVSAGKVAK